MSKIIFTIFIVLSGIVFKTNSISIVNNVTVSSDFLQELFFNEIRLNFNSSKIGAGDIINAQKCILQLREIANQFPSLKVAQFFDSWGKFPSGILYGHLTDFGNYDQCVRTSVILKESTGVINGQYCFASIPLSSEQQYVQNDLLLLREMPMALRALPSSLKIQLGVCVPDTCNAQLITKIFQQAASNVLNGTFSGVTVSQCSVAKKPDYEALDIFAIVLFSTFGLVMLLSTLYDCYTRHSEKNPVELFLAFSVIRNGKKLFMINTKQSPNTIACLTGIRVFSMIWVLYCHNYLFYISTNLTNSIDLLSRYKEVWSMTALMGSVSVDSFFLLSGLLVAWIGLRELDRTKGKLNVIMMWVHRYIRLTPALAAAILFLVTLNKYVGSGPLKENYVSLYDSCKENWWVTLLYVQNYVRPNHMCFMQSWYLACDTQLYFLSPLVLIPLWKWGKRCIPALVTLSFLSLGCIIATFIVEGYTSLLEFIENERVTRTYYVTHTRYSVWLIGLGLGYFMHINRDKSIKPTIIIQLVGWIVSLGIILSVIFGPYFKISSANSATVGEATTYEALKRVAWGIALSWIVFACHFDFGGLVNSFLSHPFWQPLARLTYCLYLVHIAVQAVNFGIIRTDTYFSNYTQILYFWSNFGISIMAAIVLSLAFEAPVLVIEKLIFGNGKSETNRTAQPSPSAPIETCTQVTSNKEVYFHKNGIK